MLSEVGVGVLGGLQGVVIEIWLRPLFKSVEDPVAEVKGEEFREFCEARSASIWAISRCRP